MKQLFYIFLAIILFGFSGCNSQQGGKSDFRNDIQPYAGNLKYWQHKEQPVLLLGGSNNDNLFQSPDVEEQLDLLQQVGGNFVRNTMSSRDSGDVMPFFRMEDGKIGRASCRERV